MNPAPRLSPFDVDATLRALLADDFDLVFPLPPIVPGFAAETVRPGASS